MSKLAGRRGWDRLAYGGAPASRVGTSHALPSIDDTCKRAAWWFTRPPDFIRRNVVTMNIQADGKISVVECIDVELPRDKRAWFNWLGGQKLYPVPVGLAAKGGWLSHLELLDERGAIIQPITDDPSVITAAALKRATKAILGNKADERVTNIMGAMVAALGDQMLVLGAVARRMLDDLDVHAIDPEKVEILNSLLTDLHASWMLWVFIEGMPGQRKSVQLKYHIRCVRPPLIPRRRPTLVRAMIDGTELYSEWISEMQPDENDRSLLRRLWNAGADVSGFAPYSLRVDAPHVRRTCSYHLNVCSEEGMEVRKVLLYSYGESDKDQMVVAGAVADNRGHLTVADASTIGTRPAVNIHLRVARQGFLFFSALAGCLIATMLWLFVAAAEYACHNYTVAAPTLLVVPSVLIIFASGPRESVLTSRLLVGVRLLILAAAACSIAAAAALAGVWLVGSGASGDHWWQDVERNWRADATVATGVGLMLLISWILAWRSLDGARDVARRVCHDGRVYSALSMALLLVAVAAVRVVPGGAGTVSLGHLVLAAVLLCLGLLSAWLAAYGEVASRRGASLALALVGGALLVGVPIFLGLDLGVIGWARYRHAVTIGLLGLLALRLICVGIGERPTRAHGGHTE
jgi:hypothetical protein